MKFLYQPISFVLAMTLLLLSACSPHSGAGVWKAVDDNELRISKLTVRFDGKAEFSSNNKNPMILWHCFWTKASEKKLKLNCTPSTNPEKHHSFELKMMEQGLAEFRKGSTLVATFKLSDENPTPKSK